MIVVDTNIIVYLYLPTGLTEHAERLLEREPDWAAPLLWRSEFRNVLALYLRKRLITLEDFINIQLEAESLLTENEYMNNSRDVLELVDNSSCPSYDCEFIALAESQKTRVVTMDRDVCAAFPETAVSLETFLS